MKLMIFSWSLLTGVFGETLDLTKASPPTHLIGRAEDQDKVQSLVLFYS